MTDITLSTQNGEPVVSSREIARHFDKAHKHVLRDIEELLGGQPNFGPSSEPSLKGMFHRTEYTTVQNKKLPMYLMNRDGFTLLAMGFTGKKATEWKIKYIQAFNAMEKQLSEQQSELSNRRLNEAIEAVNHAKKNLGIARKNLEVYRNAKEDTKNLLAEVRAIHSKNCDSERKTAEQVRQWQAYLDAQIDHLNYVAFGLPAFEQIMNEALSNMLPEKKD